MKFLSTASKHPTWSKVIANGIWVIIGWIAFSIYFAMFGSMPVGDAVLAFWKFQFPLWFLLPVTIIVVALLNLDKGFTYNEETKAADNTVFAKNQSDFTKGDFIQFLKVHDLAAMDYLDGVVQIIEDIEFNRRRIEYEFAHPSVEEARQNFLKSLRKFSTNLENLSMHSKQDGYFTIKPDWPKFDDPEKLIEVRTQYESALDELISSQHGAAKTHDEFVRIYKKEQARFQIKKV